MVLDGLSSPLSLIYELSSFHFNFLFLIMLTMSLELVASKAKVNFAILSVKYSPYTLTQVAHMAITALLTKLVQSGLQLQQVLYVSSARSDAQIYMLCQILWILWTHELRIIWRSNVHQAFESWRTVGRYGVGIVYAVAVDLADIQVGFHFLHFVRRDSVGTAPNAIFLFLVGVFQSGPKLAGYEGYDTTWSERGASVVFRCLTLY